MSKQAHNAPSHHPVSRLFERLTHVSYYADGRARAVCPGHESRHQTQSLSIRVLPDGLRQPFRARANVDTFAPLA